MVTFEEWYAIPTVQFAICDSLKGKETVFLGDKRVRNIVISKPYDLRANFDAFRIGAAKINIYHSLANYTKLPVMSVNPEVRKEQMKEFNLKASEYFQSFDLGIDFDNHEGDNFAKCYYEAKKLKKMFDKYRISYSVKCSGSGLHFDIRYKDLPTTLREQKSAHLFSEISRIMDAICFLFQFETMDVGKDQEGVPNGSFYEMRRVWKTPYSWDIKTGNIALPLTDEQFENFSFDIVKPNYIIKNIKLYKRGLLYREGDSKGFDKFLKEEIGWGG